MAAALIQPVPAAGKAQGTVRITNKEELGQMQPGERAGLSVAVGGAAKKSRLVYRTTDRQVVNISRNGSVRAAASGTAIVRVKDKTTGAKDKVTITVAENGLSIRQTGSRQFTVESPEPIGEKPVEIMYGKTFLRCERQTGEKETDLILNTETKLQGGTYQIKIGGQTYSAQAEEEQPSDLVFLSDKLALTAPVGVPDREGGDTARAEVAYQVVNQFGEDITKRYDVVANGSARGKANRSGRGGVISLDVPLNMALGSTYTVTAYIQNTTVVRTAALTLDSMRVVSEIKSYGLYSEDGYKEITMDNNLYQDAFYVLFEAFDQDKNNLAYQDGAENVIRNSMMISLSSGVPELQGNVQLQDKVEVRDVDGKKYFAVPITGEGYPSHGTADLFLRSIYNSASAQESFEIGYGDAVDRITVTPPEYVVQEEETEFEYAAVDAEGNEVRDIRALQQVDTGGKYYFSMVDGVPKLYLRAGANDSAGEKNDVFRTATNQVSYVHYQVMEPARPASIDGFRDAAWTVAGTGDLWYDMDNFTYLDQYGRTIENIKNPNYQNYAVRMEDGNGMFEVTGEYPLITQEHGIQVTPRKAGCRSNVSFRLVNRDGSDLPDLSYTMYDKNLKNRSAISEFTHRMLSADLAQIRTYSVDDISACWYEANENHSEYFKPEVKVYGILGTGDKIKLPADEFTINFPGSGSYPATDGNGKGGLTRYVNGNGSETRLAPDVYDEFFNPGGLDKTDFQVNDEGVTRLKREVEIVIGRTGQTFVKNVEIVNEPRKIVFSWLADPKTGKGLSSKTLPASAFDDPAQLIREFESWFNYEDNFGIKSEVEKISPLDYRIRVTDINSGDPRHPASVSHNGTKEIRFHNFVPGTTCNITFDFGGATSGIYIVVA